MKFVLYPSYYVAEQQRSLPLSRIPPHVALSHVTFSCPENMISDACKLAVCQHWHLASEDMAFSLWTASLSGGTEPTLDHKLPGLTCSYSRSTMTGESPAGARTCPDRTGDENNAIRSAESLSIAHMTRDPETQRCLS